MSTRSRREDASARDEAATERVVAPLRRAREQVRLDQIRRARMLARLGARIDEEAAGKIFETPLPGRRPWLVAALAAAAAVVVLLSWWQRRSPDAPPAVAEAPPVTEPAPLPAPAPAPPPPRPTPGPGPAPVPAPAPSTALLAPYLFAGARLPADDVSALLAGTFSKLEVRAGTLVRADLGGRARVTLVGPATLEVVAATATTLEARLDGGTLLGEYDASSGGTLTIHSPGGSTRIVGTVFAIEATRRQLRRVSVSRGAVEVTSGGRVVRVERGRALHVADAALAEIAPATAAALLEHERSAPPPRGSWGTLAIERTGAATSARLGEHVLGAAPLVARVPVGPTRVTLTSGGRRAVVVTDVRAHGLAEIDLPGAPPPPAPAPSPGRDLEDVPPPPPPSPLPPAPAPAPAPTAAPSAAPAYARAEDAMKRGDYERARQLLLDFVAHFPDDEHAGSAAYDLARLTFAAADYGTSRRALELLLARERDPSLRELGRYLRCRVDLATRDPATGACLRAFREDYPRSPHDAELLALLVSAALERGDCASALPLVREYLDRHPAGAYAGTARAAARRCTR